MISKLKKVMAAVLCASLVLGSAIVVGQEDIKVANAEVANENNDSSATGTTVEEKKEDDKTTEEKTTEEKNEVVEKLNLTSFKISKTKAYIMAGKSVSIATSGLPSACALMYESLNKKIATVSSKGKVKGKKAGTAKIKIKVVDYHTVANNLTTATDINVYGEYIFTANVVAKMSKKDFGKFNSENFVSLCKRKGYTKGYAWTAQWKGASKKKKTYRGIKIGSKKTTITKKYGTLSWKKCTKKDPFTLMKGLKKAKVKKYADVAYGKYKIRFYINKSSKVVAIIFACNIKKINKMALSDYM